ncbi:nuclear transport factor 2 family protein [Nocardia sp. NPDC057663]
MSPLEGFPAFQHLISNSAISVDGDTATARTMCRNPICSSQERTARRR